MGEAVVCCVWDGEPRSNTAGLDRGTGDANECSSVTDAGSAGVPVRTSRLTTAVAGEPADFDVSLTGLARFFGGGRGGRVVFGAFEVFWQPTAAARRRPATESRRMERSGVRNPCVIGLPSAHGMAAAVVRDHGEHHTSR